VPALRGESAPPGRSSFKGIRLTCHVKIGCEGDDLADVALVQTRLASQNLSPHGFTTGHSRLLIVMAMVVAPNAR
jgi:hypothetical protein